MAIFNLVLGYFLVGLTFAFLAYHLATYLKNILSADANEAMLQDSEEAKPLIALVASPLAAYLRTQKKEKFAQTAAEFDQRLAEAGGFWGAKDGFDILAFKIIVGIIGTVLVPLGVFVFFNNFMLAFLSVILSGFLFFKYPSSVLSSIAQKRQRRFFKEFPAALDIFCACSDAGLEFSTSLNYVIRAFVAGPVKNELKTMQADLRLGRTMDESLTRFIYRINVPEVTTIMGGVAQALEMGTPMAQILRESAKEMRKKRALAAEEEAKSAVVKMTLPLLLLIMPGVFIVLLGPVVKDLISTFASMR